MVKPETPFSDRHLSYNEEMRQHNDRWGMPMTIAFLSTIVSLLWFVFALIWQGWAFQSKFALCSFITALVILWSMGVIARQTEIEIKTRRYLR